MRYKGFENRDKLIIDNLPFDNDFSYLEIGPGIGSAVDYIIKKGKKYSTIRRRKQHLNGGCFFILV